MSIKQLLEREISVNDETLARGFVLSWAAVGASDGILEPMELTLLNNIATVTRVTEKFYSPQWMSHIFQQVARTLDQGDLEDLHRMIADHFRQATAQDKQLLLYTMIHLACIDNDFSEAEMDEIMVIAELLDIERRDVLLSGLLFASFCCKE